VGAVDYWCNAFTPEYRDVWDAAIGDQGLAVRVRRDPEDSFAEPAAFVARMDELGYDAVLLPSTEIPPEAGRFAYERYVTPPAQAEKLVAAYPGRFAALWTIDPSLGLDGVRRAAEALTRPHVIGLHLHTHSFDRAFDHRDLYPYYALAAEHGVPVVMQAGASGGLLPSECGHPIGIDRPAIYFGSVRFVLSHLGWPWTGEAIAMAYKHANVYLGTAAWPPNRWSHELVDFVGGAGQGKTLLGTGFPVTGHRKTLVKLADLPLGADARTELLGGAARRVFTRL